MMKLDIRLREKPEVLQFCYTHSSQHARPLRGHTRVGCGEGGKVGPWARASVVVPPGRNGRGRVRKLRTG